MTSSMPHIFQEAVHEHARGIAGVLAAHFVWPAGHAVPSTVFQSAVSLIFTMYKMISSKLFCDITIIVQELYHNFGGG